MAETEARILKAIKHNAIVCIHGHVGLGKTFAVHTILRRRAPETTIRLRYNSGANMNEIRTHLWSRLGLPENHRRPPACDQQIRDALEAEPASCSSTKHKDSERNPGVLPHPLGRRRPPRRHRPRRQRQHPPEDPQQPALHSRILDWYQFSPLTPTEVQATIPAYQKIWATAPPELILYADDMVGHGSFRNWARITLLHDALEDNPKLTLDKDLVRWVLSRIDPTTRHTPQRN
ncbi:ATP-binding protein [Streptomyces sp. YPW6]|uniref:ATP-binding protein n=1 Tax=Streptomyces sp. YPW6 TaxID=2840373 RepID=UPI001C0BF899|nr:ATP-binding protein [Streptomyces sp. YPW6]QWQ45377.1 ATP-binding protein [Streptomyces sp. YPW6]